MVTNQTIIDQRTQHRKNMIINYVMQQIPNLQNKKILDAGGYSGDIMDQLPAKERILIDKKPGSPPETELHKTYTMDIEKKLPFQENYFDICLFCEVLEHLEQPDNAVKELCRISKEIILTTPNNILLRKILRWILGKPPVISKNHVFEYDYKQVRSFFEKNGFMVVNFKAIGFFIPQIKTDRYPKLSAKMLYHFKKKVIVE